MTKKVTVISISYNQEEFIKKALDSFVMQKIDIPFEVLISDDCSTDKTPEIIKEYAQKYPDIIKPIYREKNLGVMENFIDTLSQIKSDYVVFCEADDYFTDPLKLQKQIDFLEKNPDHSICFHPVKVVFADGSEKDKIFPAFKHKFKKNNLELLLRRNFMQTNSVMYRWAFNEEDIKQAFPTDILPGDWYLHLLHAQKGKIGFINEVMSEYVRHSSGVWWEATHNFENFALKNGIKSLLFYMNVYENITNKSEKYYQKMVIPFAQKLFDVFISKQDFSQLETLLKLCPECYTTNKAYIKKQKLNKKLTKALKFLLIGLALYLIFT